MPKVTKRLQDTWKTQRAQIAEEREFTQSGIPRSPEDIEIVDTDIAVLDYLIALPIGATFDTLDIYRKVQSGE